MIDVFIRIHKKNPSESCQCILTFKNENHLKDYVEDLSKHEDVLKVEVIPVPDRHPKSYWDYIQAHFKEHFHA